jgi:hypothetical protein
LYRFCDIEYGRAIWNIFLARIQYCRVSLESHPNAVELVQHFLQAISLLHLENAFLTLRVKQAVRIER